MAILSIVQLKQGQYDFKGSCLRMPASPIKQDEFGSKWLRDFVSDMFETLYSCPTGVGLAANQVGILMQICVIDIKRDGKNPVVLINPKYSPINSEKTMSQEVCLSFPLVSVAVPRYNKIKVNYYDIWGNEHEFEAEGFKGNVFQHEIDHLKGCPHIDLAQSVEDVSDYLGGNVKMAAKAMSKVLDGGEKES